MKKVIMVICLLMFSVLGYSENFKGTDAEFFEAFNPNFDTFTKKDGSVFSGKIEVIRGTTKLPWFNMEIKDGKKNGKVVFYFKDGKIKSVSNFASRSVAGTNTPYNNQVTILYKTKLVDGTGVIKDFTENGKLVVETDYLNGVKDGKMTSYNEDGSINEVVYYRDGRVDLPPVETEAPVVQKTTEDTSKKNAGSQEVKTEKTKTKKNK